MEKNIEEKEEAGEFQRRIKKISLLAKAIEESIRTMKNTCYCIPNVEYFNVEVRNAIKDMELNPGEVIEVTNTSP